MNCPCSRLTACSQGTTLTECMKTLCCGQGDWLDAYACRTAFGDLLDNEDAETGANDVMDADVLLVISLGMLRDRLYGVLLMVRLLWL